MRTFRNTVIHKMLASAKGYISTKNKYHYCPRINFYYTLCFVTKITLTY